MYERFTDRARKVMQLANEEAHRFNHEYLGTEHILLGLLREEGCMAAQVLMHLGLTIEKAREEVLSLLEHGGAGSSDSGETPVRQLTDLTEQQRDKMSEFFLAELVVVECQREEVEALLVELEKQPESLREVVKGALVKVRSRQNPIALIEALCEVAVKEAQQRDHSWLGLLHLLLALLREESGEARVLLERAGVNYEKVAGWVVGVDSGGMVDRCREGRLLASVCGRFVTMGRRNVAKWAASEDVLRALLEATLTSGDCMSRLWSYLGVDVTSVLDKE